MSYYMIRGFRGYCNRIMRQLSSNISPRLSQSNKSYEEAVCTLNTLQSNAATVERIKQQTDAERRVQITETIRTAERAGVSLEEIDKLSIIHVSGTKGKGSTCAFCESILRNHGYRTGFFSSPHLVEVRERIRVNGKPISRDKFSSYFWDCYQQLEATKEAHQGDMPAYARFLTVMAFHAFIHEKVDVVIMEVGIGGQYDSTNIVSSPVVCGVTSLGLDHTNILGPTLQHIAWHKAGIFKPGVPAVTVPQPEGCAKVLKERASEIGNPLYLAPSYSAYDWGGSEPCKLGIDGEIQELNATLALQLSHIWLQNHSLGKTEQQALYSSYPSDRIPAIEDAKTFKVTDQSKTGLETCHWAGRNQKVFRSGVTYYIDGAHTGRSVKQCAAWFLPEARKEALKKRSVAKVLMFNLTGERDPETLLRHLVDCDFDAAVFCPNIPSVSKDTDRADQHNLLVTPDSQCSRCINNRNAWLKLSAENTQRRQVTCDSKNHTSQSSEEKLTAVTQSNNNSDKDAILSDKDCRKKEDKSNAEELFLNQDHSVLCNTIEEAIHWISQGGRDSEINKWARPEISPAPKVLREAEHVQVLCVGSLYLVGGLIGLLKPDINES